MLINGKRADFVSALDRGLAYGDGLFETVRVLDGQPVLFSEHMSRLRDGCRALALAVSIDDIESDVRRLLSEENAADAVLKIVVTRGEGRGYSPDPHSTPTRIVSLTEYRPDPRAWQNGVKVMMCRTRLAANALLAGIKHLNRLEQVMAAAELGEGVAEGLTMNGRDELVEGTRTNLFLVEQGRLVTPDLSEAGVRGTVRQFLLERMPAIVEPVNAARLSAADEVFVCNSVVGIWPVVAIENGEGVWSPGPLTRSAQSLLTNETGMRD